jgi:hypothetical protein
VLGVSCLAGLAPMRVVGAGVGEPMAEPALPVPPPAPALPTEPVAGGTDGTPTAAAGEPDGDAAATTGEATPVVAAAEVARPGAVGRVPLPVPEAVELEGEGVIAEGGGDAAAIPVLAAAMPDSRTVAWPVPVPVPVPRKCSRFARSSSSKSSSSSSSSSCSGAGAAIPVAAAAAPEEGVALGAGGQWPVAFRSSAPTDARRALMKRSDGRQYFCNSATEAWISE